MNISNEKNILKRLSDEITASGYVGDTTIPCLVWLASHTRFTERPVSVVIFGPSGCGKSFALKTALDLLPDDALKIFHGMSEKAIVYSNRDEFRNRHIVIQEAAGMSGSKGSVYLRQLLTEGRLSYKTVDGIDGELAGREIEIEGPTGLFMTTTEDALHPEDASRVLCVNVKEDEDQIKAILQATAEGKTFRLSEEAENRWKVFSDEVRLSDHDVVVPYAVEIASRLPSNLFRIQRDFTQVLNLIKTCALLHQSQRGMDKEGRVIATLADYETVRGLVDKILAQGMEASTPDNVRDVVKFVRDSLIGRDVRVGQAHVSLMDISKGINRDRSAVSRSVNKAIELGHLKDLNPGQGRESQIVVGGVKIANDKGILPNLSIQCTGKRFA